MSLRRALRLGLGLLAFAAIVLALRLAVAGVLALADRAVAGPDSGWAPTPVGGTVARPDLEDWTLLTDLAGTWDFRLGDDPAWASETTDAGWDTVPVPARWEEQGYPGYDGIAWYRRSFVLDAAAARAAASGPTYLLLGRVDDSDEAWLNGVRVGRTGQMPPAFETGYYDYRVYPIPAGVLRTTGENTVAVRVYDGGLEGGIVDGPVGLATTSLENAVPAPLVADLAGDWRFARGDDASWADPDTDDRAWATIRVPGAWERQGYAGLDGVAWYRTAVELDAADRDLVLRLGWIDDLDEAFVNGVRVGGTGDLTSRTIRGDEWLRERAYPVPRRALRVGRNVIAVRVYDAGGDGGIYRGTVGLAEAHRDDTW